MKTIGNFHFRNWARNVHSRPATYFLPETEDEILHVISEACKNGKRVRVVGGGHSWSDAAGTNDYMISLDKYDRVLNVDVLGKRITVQSGIRLRQLNKILEEHNLALVNLGSVSEQSIAGAISTATHGTGINFRNLSSQVVAMRVLQANGSTLDVSDAAHGDLLNYFRVSLGALGIISQVTIQCTEKFYLEENAAPMVMDTLLAELPGILKSNQHVKLWWFPHVEELMVYRYNRTDKNLKPFSALETWFNESFMVRFVFTVLLELGRFNSSWIPAINRVIKMLHFKSISRVDLSYKVFNVPMPPRHRETEYAFPAEDAVDALRDLRKMIETQRLKVNFVVEVRFVKGDDYPLSPCFQRDTCYIGAYFYGDEKWKDYITPFEKLMKRYKGRPHWGKEFSLTYNDLKPLYPKLDDFLHLKNQFDPAGIFENEFIGRIFNAE